MNYSIYNKKKSDTIIFLNGAGVGQWMWTKQIKNLKDYQLITFDYLGHTADNKHFVNMQTEINRLKELIQNHCTAKVYLVGFSLGAQISLLAQQQLLIDKAIIISTLNKPNKLMYQILKPFIKLSMPFVKYKWYAKLNASQLNIKQELFENYFVTSKFLSYKSLKNIYKENMSFKFGKVNNEKTRVLVGANEVKVVKQSAQELSSNFIEINNAGHDIPYNHFEKLNKLITQFFK